jgi:hypothetical protein
MKSTTPFRYQILGQLGSYLTISHMVTSFEADYQLNAAVERKTRLRLSTDVIRPELKEFEMRVLDLVALLPRHHFPAKLSTQPDFRCT